MNKRKISHKRKTNLLLEQSGYNPGTDDNFDPCSMAQFDLNCVYAGRRNANGSFTYVGGGPGFPPQNQVNGACGVAGYNAVANPPQPCLFYDVNSGDYFIYDINISGTNDCGTGSGCAWGSTVTYADGSTEEINFIGYECNTNSLCEEDNSGSATYNTEANCISSGCAGSGGQIGCNDIFSYDYSPNFGGCDSANTGLPNPLDESCCGYLTGCMDDRVDSTSTYLSTSTAWPNQVGPPSLVSNGVVADYNNIVQLDDSTNTPWGFNAATISAESFGSCVYPQNNLPGGKIGCTDDTANNYDAAYEAGCSSVSLTDGSTIPPVLIANDPYFSTVDTSCCTYDEGCMDEYACNYDPEATVSGTTVCDYMSCSGCMDPISADYIGAYLSVPNNPVTGTNLKLDCGDVTGGLPQPVLNNNDPTNPFGADGCCNYISGCMDFVGSINAVPSATSDCQGDEIITGLDFVNNPTLVNPKYGWPSFNNTDGGTSVGPGATVMSDGSPCCSAVIIPIEGCLDSDSLNHNAGADGCPGMDPTDTANPLNLDGYGNLDAANNSCCLYNTYCQDIDANNDSPDQTGAFPCNDVDFGPEGLYYGETGFQPIYAGAVHFTNAPGTTTASDNDCCTYNQGCTDPIACNYDSLAYNDDGDCSYIIGCTTNDQDNYDPNADLPCLDDGVNTIPSSNGSCVYSGDTGYSGLSDPAVMAILTGGGTGTNNCCCVYGCTDNTTAAPGGAWNYDSSATCDDTSCQYYTYGCSDITALISSYDPLADGCLDPNGSLVPGTTAGALATGTDEHHCCIYVEPTWTFRCVGEFDASLDDAGDPPSDGWGDCQEITSATHPLEFSALLGYQNNYGVTLLFSSSVSLADAASACANAGCGNCGNGPALPGVSLPTAGCSSCAAGAQGQSCGTYASDFDAIEDAFDPTLAGVFLFFDDIDDCNSSPLCGLETLGCTDSNYCEYWTQVQEVNDGIGGTYVNAGAITDELPIGSMIGNLGPTVLANGCITAINKGCPLTGSTNYDPSATTDCLNPYVGDVLDPWYDASTMPAPFYTYIDVPITLIDWNTNSFASIIMDDCEFSCEEQVVNGLTVPGAPDVVIENGGSCFTCTGTITSGQQTMAPCTEVDTINLYTSLMSNSSYTLQWFDDDGDCDSATFCGGSLGCSDDGSGNVSVFTAGRNLAQTNISPAWSTPGPEACNYDNDPTLAPDPSACVYTCVACMDDGDPDNTTNLRPSGFIGPAFNKGFDCSGNFITDAQVPATENGETCCCYIEGCTDKTANNWDPTACFDDGSCNYDIFGCTDSNASNYDSSSTAACDGNNGYPPNDYSSSGGLPCDPADIGTPNCCCSDVGFDCEDNLCTPHLAGGVADFPNLQACKDGGCGDGRYRCQPYVKIKKIKGDVVFQNSQQLAEQSSLGGGNVGNDLEMEVLDKEINFVLNTDPDTPVELDCCVPDPMGPHLTLQDCVDNSECGDCDQVKWKCKRDGSTQTQSNDICVQTVQADPDCLGGGCFNGIQACIASGCEHNRETWVCPGKDPTKVPQQTMGEQSTGLSIIGGQGCIQQGYFGWDTEQECLDNTDCWKTSTNDTNPYCFVGESKVKMSDGTEKRIDEIKEGDLVLNDEGTESKVVEAQKHVDFHDNIYGFNGEEPFVTAEHPLLVEGDIWKSIDPTWHPEEFSHDIERFKLEIGDKLIIGEDKETKVVTSIDEYKLEVPVYNLQLDVVNTYYVNEYVSHNAFFRDKRISEERVGVDYVMGKDPITGNPVDPNGGCPCINPPNTYHPDCCLKNPNPPSPATPTLACCKSKNNLAVDHSGCGIMNSQTYTMDYYPYGYLACCVPVSALPIMTNGVESSDCTATFSCVSAGGVLSGDGSGNSCFGGGINEPSGLNPKMAGGDDDGDGSLGDEKTDKRQIGSVSDKSVEVEPTLVEPEVDTKEVEELTEQIKRMKKLMGM